MAVVDERRIATVLFADLVGFTGMSEGRDPERIKQVVDRCFERLADDIVAHGGRVDKILGDAIIAVFGAPVAHEDDPERAVRAALQLRESVARSAEEAGLPLQLRIGINTGEVLIGAMRAGGDTTAMGDAVNVASRLQTAASPGQIVVGPDTHAQTSSAVRYEALGPLTVRNRDKPVEAHAALEAIALPGQRMRRARTPFVGRAHELGLLRSAFHLGLDRRRPQLVVIVGEAGIGKSRLAEEVATCASGDALVLDTRCVPYGEANVWWPLAEALRQTMASAEFADHDDCDPTAEEIGSLLAKVTGLETDHPDVTRLTEGIRFILGDPDALADVDPSRARDEALRAAVQLLEAIARHRPVVLGISELHWADDVVLEFIDRALTHLTGLPVVILASSRPELMSRWQPRGGRHGVVELHLEPFTDDESVALLTTILEGPPPADLTENLLARSGGNPLFLEELALLVRDAGPGRDLPATLRGLVATRLDGLSRSHRRVLDDAAVVGRIGTTDALSALRPDETGALDEALAELAAQDLIELDDRRWTFRSDVVREVAYETLSKAERARRHAQLADWFEGRSGDEVADLEQLAFHAASAAELVAELGSVDGVDPDIRQRSVDAIDRAAGRAVDRESSTEALRLYDRGMALLAEGDDPLRGRFLAGRGRANTLLGRAPEARTDLDDSLAASRDSGDRRAEARALTAKGQLEQSEGNQDGALELFEQAQAAWAELNDTEGEARVLRLLGTLHLMADRVDEALVAVTAARERFEQLGDRRGLAWAQQQLGWIAFSAGDPEAADAHLTESIAAFTEMHDFGGLAWAAGLLAWVRLQQGHVAEAEELAEQILARGETDAWASGMMSLLLASTRLWTGRTDEAIERAEWALERFRELNDRTGQLRSLGVLLRALVAGGRAAEAMETIDRYRDFVKTTEHAAAQWLARTVAVQVLTAAGLASKALDIAEGDETHPLGLSLLLAGRVSEAVARLSRDWAQATGPGSIPDAGSSYALALAVAGRHEEADAIIAEVRSQAAGTYHDRMLLHIAAGLAGVLVGDHARSAHELDLAVEATDGTGDQMAQAIARLARGHICGHGLDGDVADARQRLAAMGLADGDWERLLSSAVSFSSG
ncbi:MAG: tetratricopeptide repeat protein [Acidimicrobiales bacterium]